MTEHAPPPGAELAAEIRRVWESNAIWWAERIGEGNHFQRLIVDPATAELLAPQPGETILDVACGNGNWSRRLAAAGCRVVAFDLSAAFVAWARERTVADGLNVEYHVLDATDEPALLTLGAGRFDGAVCNMALMDMIEIGPLFRAVSRLLRPGGRFVFSVSHPCLNSTGVRWLAELEDRGGELVPTYSVRVVEYLRLGPTKGVGIVGQPEPHWYFDRPLHVLFGEAFRAGLVLDGLAEPADPGPPDPSRPFSSVNRPGIPPALVARLRRPA